MNAHPPVIGRQREVPGGRAAAVPAAGGDQQRRRAPVADGYEAQVAALAPGPEAGPDGPVAMNVDLFTHATTRWCRSLSGLTVEALQAEAQAPTLPFQKAQALAHGPTRARAQNLLRALADYVSAAAEMGAQRASDAHGAAFDEYHRFEAMKNKRRKHLDRYADAKNALAKRYYKRIARKHIRKASKRGWGGNLAQVNETGRELGREMTAARDDHAAGISERLAPQWTQLTAAWDTLWDSVKSYGIDAPPGDELPILEKNIIAILSDPRSRAALA